MVWAGYLLCQCEQFSGSGNSILVTAGFVQGFGFSGETLETGSGVFLVTIGGRYQAAKDQQHHYAQAGSRPCNRCAAGHISIPKGGEHPQRGGVAEGAKTR